MIDAGSRPAVFLDRDGTLIHDRGYLQDAAEVALLPGVAEALLVLEAAGYLRIVITNQSGIGRGRVTAAGFAATERELGRQLALTGALIDASYHCPHLPDAGCTCRKPGTALHREAIARFDIDVARSWCIGDQERDLLPATELGCRALLVLTGQGEAHRTAATAMGAAIAPDLGRGIAALSRYT